MFTVLYTGFSSYSPTYLKRCRFVEIVGISTWSIRQRVRSLLQVFVTCIAMEPNQQQETEAEESCSENGFENMVDML